MSSNPKVYSPSHTDREAAEFVRDLCASLRELARKRGRGFETLAYILDMARLEATGCADVSVPDATKTD